MKRNIIILFLIVLCALTFLGTNGVAFADDERGEAYKVLKDFIDNCPNRVAFSAGEELAAQYLNKKFMDMGYESGIRRYGYDDEYEVKNVVAVKKGSSSDKKVVVTAHMDNVDYGNGAFDNGSGITALLLVAKELKNVNLDFDVDFVAFGSEEVGMFGSQYYLKAETDLNKIVLNINFDVCAGGANLYMYSEDVSTPQLTYFAEMAKEAGGEIITPVTYLPSFYNGFYYYNIGNRNDGYNFRYNGIPSMFFFSGSLDNEYETYTELGDFKKDIMHTSSDTLEVLMKRIPNFEKQIESVVKTAVIGLTNSEFTTKINSAVVVEQIVYELPRYLSYGIGLLIIIVSAIVLFIRKRSAKIEKVKAEDIFEM